MRLILTLARNGEQLDVVTVSDSGRTSYETGSAKPVIQQIRQLAGNEWTEAATDWSNGYLTLREEGLTAALAFDPNQKRDRSGQWADGSPDVDLDDEEDADGGEEDAFDNVRRFPSSYLRGYGHVVEEYDVGAADLYVAKTDKGKFHVARGENDRQVLLELDDSKAESLADFVLLFSENQPAFHITDPISGATLRSLGDGGVRVEWPDGSASDLDEDGATALQEGLRVLGPGFADDED